MAIDTKLELGEPPRAALHPLATEAPQLSPDLDVAVAFQTIASTCMLDLIQNAKGLLESDDPEFLRRVRIALRRQRLVLKLFGPAVAQQHVEAFGATLAWLSDDLGEARDWDVFVLETLPALAGEMGDEPERAHLEVWAQAERTRTNRVAREDLSSKRYTRALLELTDALTGPTRDEDSAECRGSPASLLEFARAALARRHRKVARRVEGWRELDRSGLHVLRMDTKKLRLVSGLFGGLWPKKRVNRYLAALADLHVRLGAVNDAAVAERLIVKWRQEELSPRDLELLGLVRGWSRARATAQFLGLRKSCRRFRRVDRFWRRDPR